MKEIRKDLKNLPDYEVSNYGHIISKARKKWSGKGWRDAPEQILSPVNGSVQINNKTKFKIKDLIAEYFLEYPTEFSTEFYEVIHIDGDELNNRVDNLKFEIKDSAMRVFDLEGNWLQDTPNAYSFMKSLNIDSGNMYKVARGALLQAQGFQFRYIKQGTVNLELYSLPSIISKRRSDLTPIAKYWNNKLICVYNSITEAAENNELDVKEIWQSYERNKEIKGFLFKKII